MSDGNILSEQREKLMNQILLQRWQVKDLAKKGMNILGRNKRGRCVLPDSRTHSENTQEERSQG